MTTPLQLEKSTRSSGFDDASKSIGFDAHWSQAVQPSLAAVEALLRKTPPGQHASITAASERLFAAGGKRMRPALSLLSASIFGVDAARAVSLAAGVEMLHTATLVHDDLIDQAHTRRGAATLNADGSTAAAVLVGDYLFARAANLVAQTDHVRIMDLFARTLMVILNGEVAQRFSRWEIDRAEYEARIYAKTAALFVLAAQAGAVLGNASAAAEDALVAYGHAAGLAFQIVDDMLDFGGSPAQTGKPTGADLRQGLFTLPAIYYAEAHPDDPDLLTLLEAKDGDHPSLPRLVEKVRASSAMEAALDEARQLSAQAQRALERLPYSVHTDALAALARSAVERKH